MCIHISTHVSAYAMYAYVDACTTAYEICRICMYMSAHMRMAYAHVTLCLCVNVGVYVLYAALHAY